MERVMISKKAKVFETGLRIIGVRKIISRMMRSPKRSYRNELPPKSFFKEHTVEICLILNRKCIMLKHTVNPKKHIFYFHGGAYTMQAQKPHWHIIDRLLRETQCMIIFINYPLAPEFTCVDTINMVSKAYSYFCKTSEQEIILMGDSAGGGLALALAQLIKQNDDLPKPDKLVLFSPWLDVSMEIPLSKELEESDLILDKKVLKIVGEKYAGDLDTKNPLCSPLYGDLIDIKEVALFTGTNEILHVQAKRLRDMLVNNNKKVSYYEYEKMQHVWVMFPIPEAKDALNLAALFINK
jgi:acetyl esterase/lipase